MNSFYLYPGRAAAFKETTLISTLLGSCVAIALYDPVSKVGGLNHYLLPEGTDGERENARYGSDAIKILFEECCRLGADPKRLQAKVYGGANVISSIKMIDSVGDRNIRFAEESLRKLGIPIVAKDVGGEVARTIRMNTSTFEIQHIIKGVESSGQALDVSGFAPLSVAQKIKVLIVDDSATVRTLFTNIFTKSGLEVVGAAADAYQAREMIVQKSPDVLTLDIEMPKMSGVLFLEKLMAHHPVPVVMVSSLSAQGEAALRSLDLGAVEFVHKPSQFDPIVLKGLAESLVSKVKAAASLKIMKKRVPAEIPSPTASSTRRRAAELKVITVGGNAGSAAALEVFIKNLANDTPPVVIACSTISMFAGAFADKVKKLSKVSVQVSKEQETLQMGTVYLIPSGFHGTLKSGPHSPILKLEKSAPVASQLPSATVLFQSAAKAYAKGVYAILFGGFGTDGVEGLQAVQTAGGFTVIQSPDEAQFPYAPQAALASGFADEVLLSAAMAQHLMQYRNQNLY